MAGGVLATRRLEADSAGIAEAARLLAAGRLVAFPTETVYGLGADATSAPTIAALYRAKGRPARNPLIVHLPDATAAEALAPLGPLGRRLAGAFWPGPLTLVVPRRAGCPLADAVTAGADTVALRVPAHPVAHALLAAAGRPVAAPSANPSGRVSPTTAAHVLDRPTGLGGRIDAVLDGGPCPVGVESTILGLDGQDVRLLRPGGVAVEALARVLGAVPSAPAAPGDVAGADALAAPGMMASHYAPAATLRLGADAPRPGEGWLGFGPDPAAAAVAAVADTLSPTGDPAEAATRLFGALRRIDAAMPPGSAIAVAPVPETGLGRAVNDRLRRAAAPRPRGAGDQGQARRRDAGGAEEG
ncbi:MAG: L-threonylcarbamoyladenylate synthase [Pseudomonadota bacterium]